ncbi:eukaryotic mitochondrial regulator protein-domain-containing protein [Ganoderma leucocontextum]|nr:eukaryotic mitochondrial regulator protein-domain-containing protein [Ganoderma leucocontextum]
MLAHLTQVSRRPATRAATAARTWLSVAPRRQYAKNAETVADPFEAGPSYAQWLRTEGIKYKEAHRPNNWLGGEVPFPLNPSFKPPTPISDSIRTAIWNDYIADPAVFNVRVLAQRHGLSIARVDAILRLKGLEEHWRKVWCHIPLILRSRSPHTAPTLWRYRRSKKPLQSGFLNGMEDALGVTEKQASLRGARRTGGQELGEDAVEADELSEATKNVARDRYQRLFWEPVLEGQSPTLPETLASAVEVGKATKATQEKAMLNRLPHLKFETEPEVVLERPGRPTFRFVDVGVKFVDVKDQLKRVRAAKRRAHMREKRKGPEVVSPRPPAGVSETASITA